MTEWMSMIEGPQFEVRSSSIDGRGVFASERIPVGRRVMQYLGQVISKAESLRQCEQDNHFIFRLDDERDLDGNVPWNPARFLNHSCSPNCEAIMEQGRIWLVSTREILANEELTFNYGYDLENYQEHPCQCGAPNCVGYIVAEEFFPLIRSRSQPADDPPPAAPAFVESRL